MKPSRPPRAPHAVIGIPVQNEAEHITRLLHSLAAQRQAGRFAVVLLLNNCTDDTAAIVAGLAPSLPFAVHAPQVRLDRVHASAGHARRLAMEAAADLVDSAGLLLSTDADGVLPPDWIGANLRAIAAGAEAVAGRALIDPADEAALPAAMVAEEERVQLLTTLLDQIDWLIDPDPADPWPRHTENSGASIAATTRAYRSAGGIPEMRLGEDRAFFQALRRRDARIRHAPEVTVTVSGRLYGRARGGMADTMRRRMTQPDAFLDDNIEHAGSRLVRACLRRQARTAWRKGQARLLGAFALPPPILAAALAQDSFGAAWESIEQSSPVLRRAAVPREAREREILRAGRIVAGLQSRPGTASVRPRALRDEAADPRA